MSTEPQIDADPFDPSQPTTSGIDTLIVGCGNLLRGDDATGPVLIRRMWERGLPKHVHCADGGTGGMDVAFQMRGVRHVILVDACQSGERTGRDLRGSLGMKWSNFPQIDGINLHAFRWDHAIAFGRLATQGRLPGKSDGVPGRRVQILKSARFSRPRWIGQSTGWSSGFLR